jgi:hypothetical protein
MPATPNTASVSNPIRSPLLTVGLAWLVPGAGHLLLGKRGRAITIFATVVVTFVIGLLLRGPMFTPGGPGDILSRLIQYAGFIGDVAAGFLYFLATWFGYAPPDQATHSADYGSKFLVAAGLLNILAMVDAYEIVTGQKD